MYILGYTTMVASFVFALYGLWAYGYGIKRKKEMYLESGKGAVLAVFVTATIGICLLVYLLVTNHFEYKYVASYTNSSLAWFYRFCALWAGNAGSLLLWAFLLSLFALIIAYSKRTQTHALTPYALLVLLMNLVFFFLVLSVNENPFKMTKTIPFDGNGMNPMLLHPGMIIHPVSTYVGYVVLAVPFAYTIGALFQKDWSTMWVPIVRRWTLIAWFSLTIGNIVGAWWAYVELGWGGYWAWDPVENASFMPWLTTTALLHSLMMQEKKQMLKGWNVALVIVSYFLTLFGTFIVRSGVLTSVHAFSNSTLGTYFLIFMIVMFIFTMYVVVDRAHVWKQNKVVIEHVISKEMSFLVANLIFIGGAVAIFWGTIFPLVSEMLNGKKVNVGPPYFNEVTAPIFLSLILLMAICPIVPWKSASLPIMLRRLSMPLIMSVCIAVALYVNGKKDLYVILACFIVTLMIIVHMIELFHDVWKRRKRTQQSIGRVLVDLLKHNGRKYGGYIVHIGVAFIAFGVIGSQAYSVEMMKTLSLGESVKIGKYELLYKSLDERYEKDKDVVYATLKVHDDNKKTNVLEAEKWFYHHWKEPSSEVALQSSIFEDLYVVLSSWESDRSATFLIKMNPLVSWIWIGGIIMMIGAMIAMTHPMRGWRK
ncbi:cytochrome c-type biogenesis protein CcmF [Anoxybacillus tengchongensis]|uniref:Cytochrome c-type biogenesis protein CcmF n=1 Tax=Anoxybacillus tengchongensis TaxID=576944 RepID=A0A7W9YNG7_9BACL|nr:cytochrome c-type biogenesis CcmF C-terminal domain-containing protein [Anoxybacillus tengchongensis]MBB6175404.1 cytochrome c-type biogenesis protein CcmF [Anoxybacillus tengchongensis]